MPVKNLIASVTDTHDFQLSIEHPFNPFFIEILKIELTSFKASEQDFFNGGQSVLLLSSCQKILFMFLQIEILSAEQFSRFLK